MCIYKNSLCYLVIILVMSACKTEIQPTVESLIQVDREFSAYAELNGLKAAFVIYVHPDGILLRENSMPIVGKNAVSDYLAPISDDGIQLTWDPLSGKIAKSGDMGFTYGIYTMTRDTLISRGTYVSIWLKDTDGNWKYVLDTGNKGLGN